MLGYLIILFTAVPIIELALLIKVGQHIGVGITVGVVIFTGILGAYLARMQGFVTLAKIQDDVNKGIIPAGSLLDGVIILCSGILLLTPGFITDTIGFCGLIPFTRKLLKQALAQKIGRMINEGKSVYFTMHRRHNSESKHCDKIEKVK